MPVQIGDAYIRPGDIVFGDVDGVCVVPREAEDETFSRALMMARSEDSIKKALEGGMSIVEAVSKYG